MTDCPHPDAVYLYEEQEQAPEPLDLDPEPWLCTNPYCWYLSEHRESKPGQDFAFEPREWYEQDRARYRKETER